MEQSLQGDVMKTQDLPDVIVGISKNPHGYKLAWDFLRANWHNLIKKSVYLSLIHFSLLFFIRCMMQGGRASYLCKILWNVLKLLGL